MLLASGDEEEVFSDAQEGPKENSRNHSPIPTTRVEKVDDRDSYGDVPGTEAYNMRRQDAVPDELEIVGDASTPSSRRASQTQPDRTSTPGGTPIPKTIVEKIDSTSPSHGEVPRTAAHGKRQADAVPDLILQSPKARATFGIGSPASTPPPETPVPKTVVTRVDEQPSHGEVPGTEAFRMRTEDASPDVVETKGDPFVRFTNKSNSQIAADGGFGRIPDNGEAATDNGLGGYPAQPNSAASDTGFGDDFDEFEAGAEADDFGDFDDGFEQPSTAREPPQPEPSQVLKTSYPCLSFDALASLDSLLEASTRQFDALFPGTKPSSYQVSGEATGSPRSLFLTPRSHSLFTQLIAPPPLSPPNWLRSRTRRLFLVSLGVPIDLDEILPKSTQKKLVLPSTVRSDSEHRRSDSRRRFGASMKSLKDANASSTSLSCQNKDNKDRDRRKRRGGNDQLPSRPPPLDFAAVGHLCSTTEAALKNMTDVELQSHVQNVEEMTRKAAEVLEYWVKQRDAAMGEKEMFESVVGDLVKHARRVRR
ncbi:MAG: hypothetical protein LQ344_007714 [Seirophora lacunosa]|nr:MAG: hypothetical protein LQ344_007714 [Seirophora lacunosa]